MSPEENAGGGTGDGGNPNPHEKKVKGAGSVEHIHASRQSVSSTKAGCSGVVSTARACHMYIYLWHTPVAWNRVIGAEGC